MQDRRRVPGLLAFADLSGWLDGIGWWGSFRWGGMVFVADDLAAWLVGLLADAGRRRLIVWVLGTDQERALRQVATAAIQRTAAELCPDDAERAGQLAMVIDQVFRGAAQGMVLDGSATLLEGLQAEITGQLVPLDDAGLTGTDRSSADLLGVRAGVQGVIGLSIWARIDDQRQRSFVTGYPGRPPGFEDHEDIRRGMHAGRRQRVACGGQPSVPWRLTFHRA